MTLPTDYCPVQSGCSYWKYSLFNDCVCSLRDELSFYLGLLSILLWAVAEIPQIIANWRSGNSEGISLAFILTWAVGDVLNVVGCILDPYTLPTQLYTAVLYTVTTLMLIGQHVMYNWGRDANQNSRPARPSPTQKESVHDWPHADPLEGLFPSNPLLPDGSPIGSMPRRPPPLERPSHSTRPLTTAPLDSPPSFTGSWRRLTLSASYSTSPRLRAVFGALLLTGGLSLGSPLLFPNGILPPGGAAAGRLLLQSPPPWVGPGWFPFPLSLSLSPMMSAGEEVELWGLLGEILGWGMTCIYLTGRLPQILLNLTRGSVQGLSWPMFLMALGGNATYMGSILVRSSEWERVKPNLPWLLDSACCLLMDCLIITQWLHSRYKGYGERRWRERENDEWEE